MSYATFRNILVIEHRAIPEANLAISFRYIAVVLLSKGSGGNTAGAVGTIDNGRKIFTVSANAPSVEHAR